MKNRFSFLLCIAFAAILLSSCQSHFISDATTRKAVDEAFEARLAHFTHGDVFAIFDEELSEQERGAMKFLYSSMSSADLGDYEGEFFLETKHPVTGLEMAMYVLRCLIPVAGNNDNFAIRSIMAIFHPRGLYHGILIDLFRNRLIHR